MLERGLCSYRPPLVLPTANGNAVRYHAEDGVITVLVLTLLMSTTVLCEIFPGEQSAL